MSCQAELRDEENMNAWHKKPAIAVSLAVFLKESEEKRAYQSRASDEMPGGRLRLYMSEDHCRTNNTASHTTHAFKTHSQLAEKQLMFRREDEIEGNDLITILHEVYYRRINMLNVI